MSGHLCLKWNNHSAAFISSISNIQTKEKYCDATIACQGKYFPVHRVILSTCSDYFEEMFERIACPHPYIVFKDIEPGEMELLLNYMYQGEVNVVQEKLPSLIKAAEALKIKGLAVPDDLPSTKETTGRKRSHQGDDSSHSRRRNEEKRKRTSSDLNSQNDSCRDTTVSRVGLEGEEPKLIKEEPIDNAEYVSANVLSNEFSGSNNGDADNVLPSASNESEVLNKNENEYPVYDPLGGENTYIKSEDNDVPAEESYDNQSSSWTDFGDSDMQNLNLPQTSQQDDATEDFSLPIRETSDEDLSLTFPEIEQRESNGLILHRCPHCPYESHFSAANVRRHMKYKHTREKPFSCSVCDKRFTERCALQRHMRTHTGEKPFSCSICQKTFTNSPNFKHHIKMHQARSSN